MRKYRFTITAKVPVSNGEDKDVFKVEFFAGDLEKAEKFRDELDDLYFETNNAFRPQPPFPREAQLTDITDEPEPYTLGKSDW